MAGFGDIAGEYPHLASPGMLARTDTEGRWEGAPHLMAINEALVRLSLSPTGEWLCINMPYQHGKTVLAAHYFPAWYLLHWPHKRIVLVAHGTDFARGYGSKVKEIVGRYGPEIGVRLKADSRAKGQWVIQGHGGGMVCLGPEAGVVGHPADLFVIDDLIRKWQQVMNPAILEGHWNFFRTSVLGRLREGSSCVVIGTRWAAMDHFGRIREMERRTGRPWRWLVFRALAGRDDPLGRKEGEPLWPKVAGIDLLRVAKESAGRWWSAGWQQDPSPEEGGLFKPSGWPTYVDTGDAWSVPDPVQRRRVYRREEVTVFVAVDWATSKAAWADYTAMVVCGLLPDGRLMVLEVVNERLKVEECVPRLAGLCKIYRPGLVAVEAEGFQATLANECRRHREIPEPRLVGAGSRSKLNRALAAITMGQNGRVLLPAETSPTRNRVSQEEEPHWIEMFCRQLAGFTGAGDEADDMVDALSYACMEAQQLRPAGSDRGGGPVKLGEGREGGFDAPWVTARNMNLPPGIGGW